VTVIDPEAQALARQAAGHLRYGYCQCGCGRKTTVADRSRSALGVVKGEPRRYIRGHKGKPALERFFSFITEREDGCWHWTGNGTRGYGRFRPGGNRNLVFAHRWAYERFIGPIPDGLQIDHLCRNPSCVNPDHLEAVTAAENVHRCSSTRLTQADVLAIRASTAPRKEIAARYGVDVFHIYAIRNGRRWAEEAAA
jgi:hypothetical protein